MNIYAILFVKIICHIIYGSIECLENFKQIKLGTSFINNIHENNLWKKVYIKLFNFDCFALIINLSFT